MTTVLRRFVRLGRINPGLNRECQHCDYSRVESTKLSQSVISSRDTERHGAVHSSWAAFSPGQPISPINFTYILQMARTTCRGQDTDSSLRSMRTGPSLEGIGLPWERLQLTVGVGDRAQRVRLLDRGLAGRELRRWPHQRLQRRSQSTKSEPMDQAPSIGAFRHFGENSPRAEFSVTTPLSPLVKSPRSRVRPAIRCFNPSFEAFGAGIRGHLTPRKPVAPSNT